MLNQFIKWELSKVLPRVIAYSAVVVITARFTDECVARVRSLFNSKE